MVNLKYIVALILLTMSVYAQEKFEFQTTEEYLTYAEKKFDISPSDVYYISPDLNVSYPTRRSMVYFIKNNKLATIEDVAKVLGTQCSPDHMMKQVTLDAINKCLLSDRFAETFSIKSMVTGKVYKPQPDELVVVYLYHSPSGPGGQLYIKEREMFTKNLGIKSFIVSLDNSIIAELAKS